MFRCLICSVAEKFIQASFLLRETLHFPYRHVADMPSPNILFYAASIVDNANRAGNNRDSKYSRWAVAMSSGTCWPLVM